MEMLYIFNLLLLLTALTSTVADDYRLPTTIYPLHYEVHINISDAAFTVANNEFLGTVVIHFDGTTETTQIKLHASYKYILVTNVELNNADIPEQNYFTNETTDILTINLEEAIPVDTHYALRIDYIGQLSVTDMYGLYKSSYADASGTTKYLATTQFEPTHTRRAFPSWDEPSFKATFSILVTYPSELNVLSNTLGTERIVDEGRTTVEFGLTPIMSTYLVAIVISDFTCTTGENVDIAPYRVCSREESASSREWAVEIGPKIMASFDEYTGISYSSIMPKLDQVAIPDFSAGAMENWGLITYRETALLWDPVESSNSYKQSIAAIIAHEFAHSWFGNLVTCNWWSVTFLNEGFAQLLQYNILDNVLPEWELRKQFVVAALHSILDADSYLTAQALQSDASTPSEVSSKFGSITYSKGASIFRMVENILGFENFRDGLRNYLTEYQYTSAIPNDLWNILNANVNQTLSDLPEDLSIVMQNWVENSGYPLLTVTTSGQDIIVTQERFLLSGRDTTSNWYVPVTFTISTDSNKFTTTTPQGWLTPTSNLTFTLPHEAEWLILNNQQAGYYRVNYELSLWEKIATALSSPNFSEIPDINRAEIVDDVFNLAKVEKIIYSKAFEILEFLRNDVSYFPWYPAFAGFNYLLRRVGDDSLLGQAITAHLSDLMENLYQSVPISNLDESNHIYTLKQVSAVNWACRLGKQECVSSVQEIFWHYKEHSMRINKNLKSIVYCNALRYSTDSSDWEFLWQKYLSTDVATERSVLISALGCTRNETLLNSYLFKSIDSTSGIKSQDANAVFSAVYGGSSLGIDVAFNFLIQYHAAIDNYYQSMNALANLLSGLAERFTTQEQITQLENFIETGDLSDSFKVSASQSLETAKANFAWIEQFKDDLNEYYGIDEDGDGDDEDFDDSIDENESTLPDYRLSRIFKPSHYEVHLKLADAAFTASGNNFSGTVVISFTVLKATNQIKLHASAQNIVIRSIQLNGVFIPSENYGVNRTTDILTIEYENGLETNTLYMARIQYDGTFGNDNRGFYKSSYVNADGIRKYLVTTQFEPTHARRAFPCFDEPQYKATFQVLITYPSALNAKSNTFGTIMQNDTENNLLTIQFNKTPITPTYLIAFIVSDFTCTSGDSIGTVPYQVCSRDNTKDLRGWAVEIGPKLLSSLNTYTGYDYGNAIEKMDQFAIPDFAAGAMENWGIITYRETNLLWDPLVSTNSLKQSIALVIAHEFTHMWFGNLVTCKWWSETFLNEGFARYFQYYTTHDVLPDWELDKQFVIVTQQPILQTDSYLTSQPLQSPASTPADISNKFGSITYSKGASVIRMVEHFMGSENLQAGLQSYLDKMKFDSAKPEDLWESLSENIDSSVSKLPTDLESVMENWIKSGGFPLLYVSIVGNNIVISQERFLVSGVDTTTKWYVPISYTTSTDEHKFESTAPNVWLTPASNLSISYPSGAQWVILNNHQTGYYRVTYSNNLWDAIADALISANFSGIPELNRAQIADDLFNLVRNDRVPYSRVLKTLEFLENDVSYFPWYPVYSELNNFFTRVGLHTHLGTAVREHVGKLISKFYDSVPISVIDDDNHLHTLKQTLAVNMACRLSNPNCAQHMREIYADYRHNGTRLPKNFGSLVLCNGIRHSSDRSDWDFLWNLFEEGIIDSSERSTIITALGCSTNEDIITEYLSRALNNQTGSRVSDASLIFSSVYAHYYGHGVAFKFFIENHEAIYSYFQSATTAGNILRGIAGRFTSREELEELQTFVQTGGLNPALLPSAQAAITSAQQNLAWVEKYQEDLFDYFGLEPPSPTTPTITTPTITTPTITTPTITTPTITTPTTPTPTTTTTPAPTTPDGARTITSSVVLIILLVFVNKFYLH